MSAITWSNVTDFAANLSTVDADAAAAILAYANSVLDVSLFGGEDGATLRLLRIYLAAHLGTAGLRAASGASGPVVSESVGGIARSYAVAAAATDTELQSTAWGQAYLTMLRGSPARIGWAL